MFLDRRLVVEQPLTCRLVDIHGLLKKELRKEINDALFWSYMLDESTDKSVTEELIL